MVDLMIDIMIDYKYEYDGSFHIAFINWEEESCKMATGSMCMMQCKFKRWGCEDDIGDDDDSGVKFDNYNIIHGAVWCSVMIYRTEVQDKIFGLSSSLGQPCKDARASKTEQWWEIFPRFWLK